MNEDFLLTKDRNQRFAHPSDQTDLNGVCRTRSWAQRTSLPGNTVAAVRGWLPREPDASRVFVTDFTRQ
jgi:hypothetical protein